jgi:hypothetical protein
MISKWEKHKKDAFELRMNGQSLPFIHKKFGIPKSTLSSWFKSINLTTKQKSKLEKNWQDGLIKARKKAVVWHNRKKAENLLLAETTGQITLDAINTDNVYTMELALALLYLGEGTKSKNETGMGSSDPLILKFFITCLRQIYSVPENKIRCELHLRDDQDPELMLDFWSKELNIPRSNFNKTYRDKRTKGSVTYDSYKGVCLVRCGTVAIQRKLVYIAKRFCSTVSAKNAKIMRD